MIIKEDNQIGPAICCVCGKDAKINDSGKWYCAYESEMGYMNIRGYCATERKAKKSNTVTKKKGKV
mgnify:CR=1 FL=1|tara:strand:+ start:3023 stop:3220 length:198 start_codon:yes stop_codon:yes gene_type:complete